MLKKLFYIAVVLFLYSCATERPTGNTEAEVIYKEAQELMEGGRYLLAIEKVNLIKTQFPYSFYASYAELLYADILFEQDNFEEAAGTYILFKDFHPKHKKVEYVHYRIAESYFRQLPSTFDRDLSVADQAISFYEDLVQKFPNTNYKKEAIEKINKCKKMKRDREQYIADFYFKTEVYDSAVYRYNEILKTYREKDLRVHSIVRLVQSFAFLKNKEECHNNFNLYQSELSGKRLDELKEVVKTCK
ncbi:MAG: outer membrane protein assembly factor BamD [Halobacteriovoraceae bacterium]|nr:outer membrane protein assembly factor BamD [Halobacteriovoraceae bacterium]